MASGTITKSRELKTLTITNRSIDAEGNVSFPGLSWNTQIPVCFEPTSIPTGAMRSWQWGRYNALIYIIWSKPADGTVSGILYYYDKI